MSVARYFVSLEISSLSSGRLANLCVVVDVMYRFLSSNTEEREPLGGVFSSVRVSVLYCQPFLAAQPSLTTVVASTTMEKPFLPLDWGFRTGRRIQ